MARRAAKGQYLAFINNDARPDPGWLRAAVAVLERDASVVCVASKVLDWEGDTVDFVDAAVAFYGHGFKTGVGEPDHGEDHERDVLFAHGAAMVVDAEVFRDVGGFDDRYFMFFEDLDLGWRLWLLGYRVRYVPDSLVFHRHHASMSGIGAWRRALPARAQRALHDLQELRRPQPAEDPAGVARAGGPPWDRPR